MLPRALLHVQAIEGEEGAVIRKAPRRLHHASAEMPLSTRVGDLSYESTKSILPATGESPWWWPLGALASVAVIAGFLYYGHRTGWT